MFPLYLLCINDQGRILFCKIENNSFGMQLKSGEGRFFSGEWVGL
jgi:hypothetical protein